MISPFQFISDYIHTLGWGVIITCVIWLWRKSISISVEFTKRQEKGDKAMDQIDMLATNHFPHMVDALTTMTQKQDKSIETLQSMDTNIAILVDRGAKGKKRV